MPEQKITITIDNEGSITAKTSGFKGETCLDALDEILEIEGVVCNIKKTDEYFQQQSITQTRIQMNKRQ